MRVICCCLLRLLSIVYSVLVTIVEVCLSVVVCSLSIGVVVRCLLCVFVVCGCVLVVVVVYGCDVLSRSHSLSWV